MSFCSITLGGFGADRFYLGQWREGLGKLFSFGGLGIWTLIDVLLIGVGYVGPADGSLYIWTKDLETLLDGLHPLPLHTHTLKNWRSEMLCTWLVCLLKLIVQHILIPSAQAGSVFLITPTMSLPTQPSYQSQSFCIHLLLRFCRWSCAGGWEASNNA